MFIIGWAMFNAIIALLWFNTNVVPEWGRQLKLKFTKYEDFWLLYENDTSLTYIAFLANYYYNHFTIRLVSCPTCLIIWLSLVSSILFLPLAFPFICYLSFILYSVLVKLMVA